MTTSGAIKTRPLMPGFGVEIEGVDIAAADHESLDQVATHLQRSGAVLIRDQKINQQQQLDFTHHFGIPAENPFPEWCDPDYSEIYIISNKVENGRQIGDASAGLNWHNDLNYHKQPALCTMLYALEVPEEGSDTLLADVCAAWGALPPERQRHIEGLIAQHSFAKLTKNRGRKLTSRHKEDLPDVFHPLVRTHPFDGRKALWVSAPRVIRGIVGMPEPEAMKLIEELIEFVTRDDFVYRHKWRVGDVLVWDNRCTLHRGTPFDTAKYVRYVRRSWVRGEVPM